MRALRGDPLQQSAISNFFDDPVFVPIFVDIDPVRGYF